eukprot:UN02167
MSDSAIKAETSLTLKITLPQSFYDKLLLHFGYSVEHVQEMREKVVTDNIFKCKEWLDENVDLLEGFKKYQEAKNKGDTEAMQAFKDEWAANEEAAESKAVEIETKEDEKEDNKFPVQVFARFRPLIKQEMEAKHNEITYKTKSIKKTSSNTIIIDDITKKQRISSI